MKTLVLVAGVSRSGSTIVDLILGNRPDSFSLGEIYAWYRPFRSHHLDPVCACGEPLRSCPVWSEVGKPPPRHLHRDVAERLGADFVVDSSKNLGWIRDAHRWALSDGLQVQILMPWRGCKMIAHSYWKRDVPRWLENLEGYFQRLTSLDLPWQSVRFVDLVDDPASALVSFYDEAGSSFLPDQSSFWKGEFHALFGSGGTRSQVGRESSLAEPDFDATFEDYWTGLDSSIHARVASLEEIALQGCTSGEGKRLPQPWYVKHRSMALVDQVMLARRPASDRR